jgi:hypothetical protein
MREHGSDPCNRGRRCLDDLLTEAVYDYGGLIPRVVGTIALRVLVASGVSPPIPSQFFCLFLDPGGALRLAQASWDIVDEALLVPDDDRLRFARQRVVEVDRLFILAGYFH